MSNEMPLVSVIIPVYNRSHLIQRALQSVLDQTYANFELIVVDDGSTDATKEAIAAVGDKRIKYFYQAHSGEAVARNKGLSLARGKYIHFLDSDDYFLPANLTEKVNLIEAHNDIGWVYSDCYYLNPGEALPRSTNKNIKRIRRKLLERSYVFDLLLMNYFVNMDTVIIRRACLNRIGPFDESLTSFIDMDFFFRTAKLFEAKFIDAPLVVVSHQEPDSVTEDADFFYQGKIEVFEKTKRLFPEGTKKLGFPNRKERADILNYLGKRALQGSKKRDALRLFLLSIRAFPFQGNIYSLLFTTLLGRWRKRGSIDVVKR